MRTRRLCHLLAWIGLLFALLTVLPLVQTSDERAYAEPYVTVTQDESGYYYGADPTPYATLQALVDHAEESADLPYLQFSSVTSAAPVSFSGTVAIGGNLAFSLTQSVYAITVLPEADLRLAGITITSDKGGVDVKSGAALTFLSGTLRVSGNTSDVSASLMVSGTATVQSATILFENGAEGGVGIAVSDLGSLVLEASSAVWVTAPNALFLYGGETVISGGTFLSNAGGASLTVSNASRVTIYDGDFPQEIRCTGQSARISLQGGTYSTFRSVWFLQGFSGSIRILDASITPPTYGAVTLDLSKLDEERALLTPSENAVGNYGGYRAVGLTCGDASYDADVWFPLTEGVVTFIEDNRYRLRVYDENALYSSDLYPYNTQFRCADLPFEKVGYAVLSYREDSIDGTGITQFALTGDKDVYVRTELAPCLVDLEDREYVYDGNDRVVSATVSHDLTEADFSYRWEKAGEVVSTTKDLVVRNVADSGEYVFYASVTHNDVTKTASKPIRVTVQKGAYASVVYPETITGKYDPDTFLTAYPLTVEGFSWVSPESIVPQAGTHAYAARYTADPANYEPYALEIPVTLEKADAVYPPNTLYANVTGTYDPAVTLSTGYALSGTRWKTPDAVPQAGKHEFAAYYAPDENYEEKAVTVTITVAKATYSDKSISPITVAYSPELGTLTGIKNYVGSTYPHYAVTAGESTTAIGTNAYTCVYDASDDNYEVYVFTLTILVEKGTPSPIPTHPAVEIPYGSPLSLCALLDGFRFPDDTVVPTESGAFDAYYDPDPIHYHAVPVTIAVSLTILTYDPSEIPACALSPVVYDPDRTLSDVSLPQGFFWKTEDLVPTVDRAEYEAYYQGDAWHRRANVVLSLTVAQAELPVPTLADASFVYDGKPHELTLSGLSPLVRVVSYVGNGRVEAGAYQVVVRLEPTDPVNYSLRHREISAQLLVTKATSVIVAPDRVDCLVGETPSFTVSANNEEQTVSVSPYATDTVGVYTVVLSTEESPNYFAGEKTVVLSVNATQRFVGNIVYPDSYDGTYYYGILLSEKGVPSDLSPAFTAVENGVRLDFTPAEVSGDTEYTVKLLLPRNFARENLTLMRGDEIVDYSIENDVYLVFTAQNGDVIRFVGSAKKKPFVWYWIPPVGAVLIAGAVIFVLWKKGKIRLPHGNRRPDPPAEPGENPDAASDTERKP